VAGAAPPACARGGARPGALTHHSCSCLSSRGCPWVVGGLGWAHPRRAITLGPARAFPVPRIMVWRNWLSPPPPASSRKNLQRKSPAVIPAAASSFLHYFQHANQLHQTCQIPHPATAQNVHFGGVLATIPLFSQQDSACQKALACQWLSLPYGSGEPGGKRARL